MHLNRRIVSATVLVAGSLLALFEAPRTYFVAGTFAATTVMVASAYFIRKPLDKSVQGPKPWALGLASALILYGVFYGGNLALKSGLIPGVGLQESSIYSLIASPTNPLWVQVAVLTFDAAGFEAFFRGTLQKTLAPKLGVWAVPGVALFDSALHVATFNPLWVITTFVADVAWGLTYRYSKGFPASFTSHLAWDLAIFVLKPIM